MRSSAENNHNVYILGAGYSVGAGIPGIVGFLDKMRDALPWLRAQGNDGEAESIEKVLTFRLDASAAALRIAFDPENIEELFSLASASPNVDLTLDIQRAIGATIAFARAWQDRLGVKRIQCKANDPEFRKLLSEHADSEWRPEVCTSAGARVFEARSYDLLASILSGCFAAPSTVQRNTVITFNYDTVVEEGVWNLGRAVSYGFPPSVYDRSYQSRQSSDPSRPEETLPVLKLHGSVNWAQPDAEGAGLTAFDRYSSLMAAGRVPFLIPPTWKKGASADMGGVWSQALEALRTATRIVLVGFSVPPTDMHFKYLLAEGLRRNISLRKIVVVNPRVREVSPRLHGLFSGDFIRLQRVELREATAEQYFCSSTGLSELDRGWFSHAMSTNGALPLDARVCLPLS